MCAVMDLSRVYQLTAWIESSTHQIPESNQWTHTQITNDNDNDDDDDGTSRSGFRGLVTKIQNTLTTASLIHSLLRKVSRKPERVCVCVIEVIPSQQLSW